MHLAPNDNGQLAAETRFRADTNDWPGVWVQRQHPVWYEACTESQRDEVHNEVEIVRFERRLTAHTSVLQPRVETFSGEGLSCNGQELEQAREAHEGCPTASIGDD